MPHYLYSEKKYRLRLIKSTFGKSISWLFLPGGPGIGSETLLDLTTQLTISGSIWLVDYPGDGSNQINNVDYNEWSNGLVQLVESLENVVVVAHSFGGMLVLSTPELENKLAGLILMNTSPSKDWMNEIPVQEQLFQLPNISNIQAQYMNHPSDDNLKQLTLACAEYFFTKKNVAKGRKFLESLSYNHEPYDWASHYFHPSYQCQWIPKKLSTLIIGSEYDHITPLKLFLNDKRFDCNNIEINCIENSGHFPWFENMQAIEETFFKYQDKLRVL